MEKPIAVAMGFFYQQRLSTHSGRMVALLDHVIDAFQPLATSLGYYSGTTRYIQGYHSNHILPGGLQVKKPSSIQETLDRCVADATAPEQLLSLALAKAAKRRNLSLPELETQRLTTAILKAEGDTIQLDLDPPCSLGETEEEIQAAVQGLVDELNVSLADVGDSVVEAISRAVPDALGKVAQIVGDHISEQAHEHTLQLRRAHSDRAETVRCLWGTAIDQLDFLRHFALEWNYAAVEQHQGGYVNPNTAFALTRLVVRAYEVVGELITLARAGYADGALARWRSLHEICVVAMFLARRSDRCAEMYLSHHWVEELRLLEVDRASGTARAINTHRDRYVSNLRMQKTALVKKFGTAFASDYGWASVELGRPKTTFRDLESHVGLETLRHGYQQANSTVHGGALATLTRISLGAVGIDGTEAPPAYGCEVATNYAAASLSMMIAELCLDSENADLVAMSLVIHNCALKIREQVEQVQKKISGNSPRARLLMRKAAQREFRSKPRRTFRK
ncbi:MULTISPECIES: DUF5677 domain-containing protein [Diaphorobacter]|uniref:DUF5677 domain-containing protein n=1 Tax=Diaphorobacter TaxID=238749 RepID=UPI002584B606|nr:MULTISPECIES: DUF5677 domain-containing protein [Diaphorobacter]